MSTTPSKINSTVKSFCKSINAAYKPRFIRPGDGKPGFCLLNAINYYINNSESNLVSGWIIWKGRFGFMAAEHHTVVSHNGKLVDLTNTADGEDKILFLPDSNHYAFWDNGHFRTYGNFIKNIKEEFYLLNCYTKNPVGGNFNAVGQPLLTNQAKEHFLSMPYDNYSLLGIKYEKTISSES